MADQDEDQFQETEEILEDDDQEAQAQGERADSEEDIDQADEGEAQEPDGEDTQEDNGEGLIVTFGDEAEEEEPDDAPAPKWVKDLRKQHRNAQRELREAKAQLAKLQQPAAPAQLPPKPTLKGADYDDARFEREIEAWHDKKREHDAARQKAQEKEDARKQAYNSKLSAYNTAKTEMGARDFDDAESTVSDLFDATKQGIIISGAANPALVVYALGRRPDQAKRLAEIEDPIQFAFAVAKLETQLKVQSRKATPAPEKKLSGTGRASGGATNNTLDRLRAEAEKTGDYSKVMQFKAQQRQKAK